MYAQKEMARYCAAKGIHLQAYAPLADADRQSGAGPKAGTLLEHPTVTSIARARNATPGQVLLQWEISGGHSCTPRITTTNPDHIRENVAVWNGAVAALTDKVGQSCPRAGHFNQTECTRLCAHV